jgi:anti-sigma factor RsiW
MSAEREPTRDELLAMAYADGELAADERAAFEERLASEEALALEVAELRRLDVLARHAVGPEPMDSEWKRLGQDPVQRAGSGLALSLLAVGAVSGLGWLVLELLRSSFSLPLKTILGALLLGLVLMVVMAIRARLKTLPYDPYREVQR